MFTRREDQGFRLDFDAEINNPVAVIGEDNINQIFADVVNVAFDGRQDNLAAT